MRRGELSLLTIFLFCFVLHLHSVFFRLVPAEILLCCEVPAIPNMQSLVCSFAAKVEGGLFVLLL